MNHEEKVYRLIDQSKDLLAKEGIDEILHFWNHGEVEIAFEGLIVELSKQSKRPQCFDYDEWFGLLTELGLREDSVLVGDLVEVFQDWVESSRG
ncbi:MAG: hypothetical protein H6818_17210 [Phycisphaerales bacterium]|nr:hypothetical protein [Phycisphaerales bacterium]